MKNSNPLVRQQTDYFPAWDWYRGLVVILMIITHSARVLTFDDSFITTLLKFFLKIEPFTASSFLFLAGIGLHLSFSKALNKPKWTWRIIKKSSLLYLIGILFFICEHGFQWTHLDFYFAPNILSSIAFSLCLGCFLLPRPTLIIPALFAISLITIFFQDQSAAGINTGPGGLFPMCGFTLLGIFLSSQKNIKFNVPTVMLITLFFLSFLFSKDWTQIYTSEYSLNYPWVFKNQIHVWNLTFWGFMKMNGFLIITFILCKHPKLKNLWNTSWIRDLGKHSLFVYIFHLSLLAIPTVLNIHPEASSGWIGIIILIVLSVFFSKKLNQH